MERLVSSNICRTEWCLDTFPELYLEKNKSDQHWINAAAPGPAPAWLSNTRHHKASSSLLVICISIEVRNSNRMQPYDIYRVHNIVLSKE